MLFVAEGRSSSPVCIPTEALFDFAWHLSLRLDVSQANLAAPGNKVFPGDSASVVVGCGAAADSHGAMATVAPAPAGGGGAVAAGDYLT